MLCIRVKNRADYLLDFLYVNISLFFITKNFELTCYYSPSLVITETPVSTFSAPVSAPVKALTAVFIPS